MHRIYQPVIERHLNDLKQMVFLSGPRQVGKTTIAQTLLSEREGVYLNWDVTADRSVILSGPNSVMKRLPASVLGSATPLVVLDEIHKFKDWKNYLKGFFDQYAEQVRLLITGSSQLDIYVKGGDSLMGRYFPYAIHPITVNELIVRKSQVHPISAPHEINEDDWRNLLIFGGFPDPFIQQKSDFYNRWQSLRQQQLFKEDIQDLSRVSDVAQLEVLAMMLKTQVGQQVNYTRLSNSIRVSDQTLRRWFDLLDACYYSFRIRPWYKNVSRSLRKEPKVYLWDWSIVEKSGARAENFIASHLFKSTQFWTHMGLGSFDLYYLKDKDKNEVDFVVTRDEEPWFLVEVKSSTTAGVSKSLAHFKQQTQARHAFQVVLDLPFVDQDCFAHTDPIIVPAKTFLSQI